MTNQQDTISTQKDIDFQIHTQKIMKHLQDLSAVCRENKWYASAAYASMAADTIFHMSYMGDKAQRPDMLVNLTDVHYSAYDQTPEAGCECD